MQNLLNRLQAAQPAWFPIAVGLTVACGLAFGLTQQVYRQSANDPQVQFAEQAADLLSAGHQADEIIPPPLTTDLADSTQTFMAVYNATTTAEAWSMPLDGKAPQPPKGVFDYAKEHGENRVTWMPHKGVREALVIVPFKRQDGSSGYVLAGRSLAEAESRIQEAQNLALIAWVAGLLATLLVAAFYARPTIVAVERKEDKPAETKTP